MLGAGVGIVGLAPGLGVTVSARNVFITTGKPVFGAGVSWAGLRPIP
ncbi:MAG TPA: hypothetical protein VIC55_04495 [Gemmatimonadaceae bacterium]|jgi:hypothetical protein